MSASKHDVIHQVQAQSRRSQRGWGSSIHSSHIRKQCKPVQARPVSRAKDHPWLHGASREEGLPGGCDGKEPACNMGGQVRSIPEKIS